MDLDQFIPENYRIPFIQTQKWKQYLINNGFVVIADFLCKEQCQKHVNQLQHVLEILSDGKLDPKDPDTYLKNENYPPLLHGGMSQYVGHSKSQWQLRKICKPIFQQLWSYENVKSSFDGFCFMNGARKIEKKPNNAFLHCDQSPTKNYLWSYQGVMTLTNSGENQGGFVCVPKSHLYHHQYFQEKNLLHLQKDWHAVPDNEKLKQPLCYDIKLLTKAGDFILFDSRTFHANTVPTENCLRVCTYICMIPSKNIDQRVQQGRKKAIKEKRTTSHHPGDGFRTFPALPKGIADPQRFGELIDKANDFVMDKQIDDLI